MLALIYATTASGAFYAFTNWTGIGAFNFVGLDNFRRIFQTPELTGALVNTLVLAFGFLIFTNVFGLLFALALNRTLKTRYRAADAAVHAGGHRADRGVLHLEVHLRLQRPAQPDPRPRRAGQLAAGLAGRPDAGALVAVLVVMVWQNIGFAMVIYLAGLATVPLELEEAAALDGAGIVRAGSATITAADDPALGRHRHHAHAHPGPARLRPGPRADRRRPVGRDPDAGAPRSTSRPSSFGNFGFGAALALVLSVLILIFTVLQQYATRDRA